MTRKVPGISQKNIDHVLRGPATRAALRKKALRVQAYWKSVAPVYVPGTDHRRVPPHGKPGDYRDSIVVEEGSDDRGVFFRVKTTDYKRFWLEFGTKTMKARAPRAKTKAHFR